MACQHTMAHYDGRQPLGSIDILKRGVGYCPDSRGGEQFNLRSSIDALCGENDYAIYDGSIFFHNKRNT